MVVAAALSLASMAVVRPAFAGPMGGTADPAAIPTVSGTYSSVTSAVPGGHVPFSVTFTNGTLLTPPALMDAPVSDFAVTIGLTPDVAQVSTAFSVFGPGGNGEVDFTTRGTGFFSDVDPLAGTGSLLALVDFDPNSPNSIADFPYSLYMGPDIFVALDLTFTGIFIDFAHGTVTVAEGAGADFSLLVVSGAMIDLPEPAAAAVWGLTGLAALAGWRRRLRGSGKAPPPRV
jgi:hypothetical protein